MSRHLFLTGERQVGKSTLVDRLLERLGLTMGGFRTFGANYAGDGASDVCIRGAGVDGRGIQRVAHRRGERGGFVAFPEVFDGIGVELLRVDPGCGILVMDELGFMEAEAQGFQRAVMEALDGGIPVLGVIKPRSTPFLDRVRAHPEVRVLAVDEANRDALADSLFLTEGAFGL